MSTTHELVPSMLSRAMGLRAYSALSDDLKRLLHAVEQQNTSDLSVWPCGPEFLGRVARLPIALVLRGLQELREARAIDFCLLVDDAHALVHVCAWRDRQRLLEEYAERVRNGIVRGQIGGAA